MKKYILIYFYLFNLHFLSAQDPIFTQFKNSGMYINPAFAGAYNKSRLNVQSRLQWLGLDANYKTYLVSYDMKINKLGGGLGMYFMHDKAGDIISTSQLALNYAPKLTLLDQITVSPGISIGYRQKSIDWSKLTFGDMIDERYGFIYSPAQAISPSSVANFDLGAGLLVNTKNWMFGYSATHINKPNEGLLGGNSKLPVLHNIIGEYNFYLGNSSIISASGMANFQQVNRRYYGQLCYKFKMVNVGIGHSINSYVAFLGGIQFKNLGFNYNYDLYVNELGLSTPLGAHEFSLRYLFNNKKAKTGIIMD